MSIMVFQTSVSHSSELLKLRVFLGALELCGISGTVTAQPSVSSPDCHDSGNYPSPFFAQPSPWGHPEHDAGQHGAKEQREAAGHPLDMVEVAPG